MGTFNYISQSNNTIQMDYLLNDNSNGENSQNQRMQALVAKEVLIALIKCNK